MTTRAPAKDPWVTCPRPNRAAALRLFCFPYAGAGASVYYPWAADLPTVELCPIQLPGRESRMREPPVRDLAALVQSLAGALAPWLSMPFAFFGHSFGALLSFELTRELRRRGGPLPAHLIVSGRRAPHLADPDPLHALSDPGLLAKLSTMDGTPQAVLQEPELMAIFLPILRADLACNEAYAHAPEPPLDIPMSAFSGVDDQRAARHEVDAWRDHTRKAFTLEMFPGGHFFIKSERGPVMRSIARALETIPKA